MYRYPRSCYSSIHKRINLRAMVVATGSHMMIAKYYWPVYGFVRSSRFSDFKHYSL